MEKETLKSLRENAGLTQHQVATELGIDRSAVAKWELGENLPRTAFIPLLAKLYKCKIQDLF